MRLLVKDKASLPSPSIPPVRRDRLLETATRLVGVPSRTGEAGAAADELAALLRADGFEVERPAAGHAAAPAVVARLEGAEPGPTLQWDGHLDTVHLPFVPPRIEQGCLRGSGAADMKGGVAAAVEALRALRDARALRRGTVLFVAHDLHEAPWGFGEQLHRLIRDGVHGDAVMIPEPLCDALPIAGRGAATWKATLRRPGAPVHEVMRPDEPNVIAAGARLAALLFELDARCGAKADPVAGRESAFIGQIHAGEIYNQYPQTCFLEGTRRWLAGTRLDDVETELRALVRQVASESGAAIELDWRPIRDAFRLDLEAPIVGAFRRACRAAGSEPPPPGPKPFVDDGNSFFALAGVPAVTHGPRAGGQHTVDEWAVVDDLVRVATVYALTAIDYCHGGAAG